MPDKPRIPLYASATERHELRRIGSRTWVKGKTSVALPGVDTRSEIAAIDQGMAERVGDARYRINGRTYVHKPDGATYPEHGDRIVVLSNPQFRALRLLIQFGGRSGGFIRATERDPDMRDVDIAITFDLYCLREGNE